MSIKAYPLPTIEKPQDPDLEEAARILLEMKERDRIATEILEKMARDNAAMTLAGMSKFKKSKSAKSAKKSVKKSAKKSAKKSVKKSKSAKKSVKKSKSAKKSVKKSK